MKNIKLRFEMMNGEITQWHNHHHRGEYYYPAFDAGPDGTKVQSWRAHDSGDWAAPVIQQIHARSNMGSLNKTQGNCPE